jgi:hypothetical protein
MNIINFETLSWEEISAQYPDEWIVIANPVFEGMKLVNGIVLAHHIDKRVASIEGGERKEGFSKFTILFTGIIKAGYHIGLLKNKNLCFQFDKKTITFS